MPRRNFKRKPKQKSRFLRYADKASQALAIARSVASLINVEFKFYDTTWTSAGASPTGNIAALLIPQQGATDNTRNGDSIRAKSLTFNMDGYWNTAGAALQSLRVALIKTHLPNGQGLPTVLDVYDEAIGCTLMNIAESPNYQVLYSRQVNLTAKKDQFHLSHYMPLNDIVKFDGNTGAATDVQKNLYFIMVFSADATNAAIHTLRARVRYIDN